MDLGLRGKSVLVTGGNRGIGRQIALDFAKEGASVAICARNREKLEETLGEIRALGVPSLAISADLFEASECQRAVDETVQAFGRLDVLVNNASTSVGGAFQSLSDDQLMERLAGKTLAYMRCARAAIPYMRRLGGGRILCIGGNAARMPMPGHSSLVQGLGNAAVANFVKHLSDELGPDQILVNMVHTSHVKSDRYPQRLAARAKERGISVEEAEASFAAEFPIGRVPECSDVAPVVLFLASPLASAITGQTMSVDGGHNRGVIY